MKKTISILLALIMILSTVSVGVFALDDIVPADTNDGSVQAEEQADDPAEVQDADADEDADTDADADVDAEDNDGDADADADEEEADADEEADAADDADSEEAAAPSDEDADEADEDAVSEEAAAAENEEAPAADGAQQEETATIAAPTGLKSYSAYQSIALEWKPVKGAKGYYVYRGKKLIATVDPTDPASRAYDSKKIAYIDKGLNDGPSKKTYKYRVAAFDDNSVSEKSKAVKDECVRQMYIKATFNQTVTLTSHDGKNKKHTFHSGDTIYATGYTMGKYHFYYEIKGKTYLFHAMYGRLRGITAKYTKSFNYSIKEAEYFVNTCGKYSKSETKYLIWVNLYTQHVYIMKKTKGVWRINKKLKYNGKVYKDWEVSSGTAHTPSPWGLGLKYHGKLVNIYNRKASFPGHGANLWNFYHSETALHGPAGNAGYGIPHSHGCIRNPQENALFIFNKIPKKTRVIVF